MDGSGFVLVVVLVAAALVGEASAATYVVGDNLGWSVPSTPNEYSTWASRHVFMPGDVLVFNFISGQHDVGEVTKAAFDGCSSTSPIILSTVGPWNVTLNTTGEHFYICTFGAHCTFGQKLAINVTATASPSPAPSPPMIPTPPPAPMVAPTPSPTPSPPGSPSPTPSPMPMHGSPGSAPSPGAPGGAPTSPGSAPSPGTPRGAPTSPGELSPPSPPAPGSSATVSTISVTLVVLASIVFGLTM